MKPVNVKLLMLAAVMMAVVAAEASMMDRPQGVKIGQRLTLRPYVSFDYTWDSNADQQGHEEGNRSWYVNPHLGVDYQAEQWSLNAEVFYGYRAYESYAREENSHDYGESLNFNWFSTSAGEKGWSILINEQFRRVSEDDDLHNNNGRGLWRQRGQFDANGAIERRFTEKLHANVNGGYSWLDYDNAGDKYMTLYGWQRITGGAEIGYALSHWTDFIIDANYQSYVQDNSRDLSKYSDAYPNSPSYSDESQGYTVQAGLQSFMTERITYRLLAGWSRFEYGGESSDDGFTYTASSNWKITDTWNTMLMAQSYYQPSEREYGSATRVDGISWGITHTMVRGKLNATADIAYRHERSEYSDASAWEYNSDIVSARLGLDYTLNRFFAIYGHYEYQFETFDGQLGGVDRDYDRHRFSVGFRLQY